MWKRLFAEPPPNAVENLLTPQRKLVYGVMAFAPGTLLALYLSSVKRRMDEENEVLRQKHIEEEFAGEVAREQKDLLLTQMIAELRERIEQLEREARADTVASKSAIESAKPKQPAEKSESSTIDAPAKKEIVAKAQLVPTEPSAPNRQPLELPAFLAEYEAALRPWIDRIGMAKEQLGKVQDRFATPTDSDEQEPPTPAKKPNAAADQKGGVAPSGIRERVNAREREMIAQDIRKYKSNASHGSKSSQ